MAGDMMAEYWANGKRKYAGLPHHRTMVRRIDAAIRDAPDQAYNDGLTWYDRVYDWCVETGDAHGIRPELVAGAFAWLSPGADTGLCFDMTLHLISAWEQGVVETPLGIHGYGSSMEAPALDCLDGNLSRMDFTTPSRKVRTFWRNIVDPASELVTVDRWAARIAGAEKDLVTGGAYRAVEDAYQTVARRHGIEPRQAQAIAWIAVRGGASLTHQHRLWYSLDGQQWKDYS